MNRINSIEVASLQLKNENSCVYAAELSTWKDGGASSNGTEREPVVRRNTITVPDTIPGVNSFPQQFLSERHN